MDYRALIAMSGGVDSSVAAYLTRRDGAFCVGATMRLYNNEDIGESRAHTCCSLDDVEDARAVAFQLDIPYYVFNFTEDFHRQVMDRFVAGYEAGETPNPCIDCNRYMKFDKMLCRARQLGLDCLVTGHYARIAREGGRWLLKKGLDGSKDQSYVLYAMTQDQLAHTRFPVGELRKEQVREIALEQGFGCARKHDSQDICFVPDGDCLGFMARYTGRDYAGGPILDRAGREIGRHRGAAGYTLGQRRGLGVACGEPVYVCAKSMADNTITVGPDSALYASALTADDWNWIAFDTLTEPLRVTAKVRYRQAEQPALAVPLEDGRVRLAFDRPQRAITPGQAVVLYDGDLVLGGGTIRAAAD